jgi:hypothetical protein
MLGLWFGDLGEDTAEAFVSTKRAATERGARRIVKRWLVENGYVGDDNEPYDYLGVTSLPMHNHGCDEACPDGERCPATYEVHALERRFR